MRPVKVTVYGRPGCHLCDEAEELLRAMQKELQLDIECISIEGQPDLESQYGQELPVVLVEGKKLFKYRVDPGRLRKSVQARRGLWKRLLG